ncbi:hypothetical protein CVIRNUC_006873 [Coccomyxa viridis]|uniref:Uncharacterized protein n=1 Tax=Coccomyxa viridis TaxID=1274662 RepID=A0AAV1I8I7_9CHLO|nr:hypothetical protein CVIRNUC_006873 [Coccomyxa viridis]
MTACPQHLASPKAHRRTQTGARAAMQAVTQKTGNAAFAPEAPSAAEAEHGGWQQILDHGRTVCCRSLKAVQQAPGRRPQHCTACVTGALEVQSCSFTPQG